MRVGPFGLPELLIIVVILMLIFGAKRIPEITSSLGRGIRTFKSAVTGEDDKRKEDENLKNEDSTAQTSAGDDHR